MRRRSKQGTVLAAFAVCAAALVFTTSNNYYLLVLALVFVWATLGLSWNVLGGYAGIVSFGHSAMFGAGAYATAILFNHYGVTPWLGWLLGGAIGALGGVIIGAITFRLRGQYFSLATIAFPLAIMFFLEWMGWNEVSLPMRRDHPWLYMEFEDGRVLPLLALALLAVSAALCLWIERSRFGLSLFAIRQNELAALTSGIPALRWKLKAIALSGAMAGLAGGLYAVLLLIVTPVTSFGMLVSAQALIIPMFGGAGSVWGPLIGAVVLVPTSEILNATLADRLPGIQGAVYGLAIMGIIIWTPQGVYWALRDRFAMKGAARVAESIAMADAAAGTPTVRRGSGSENVLRLENLSVRFGGLQALSDVTFAVRRGEILGVIGPNGAGKTTLFNAINGIVPFATGSVTFGCRELIGHTPDAVNALGLGRTFQTARAFPRLSLFDNVLVGAFKAHPNDSRAHAAAWKAVRQVGLESRSEEPASSLNSRELRLMELGRALAGDPELVLMDESFAGLSSADVEVMMALIGRLRDDGLTIVIIEHTMSAMVRLADRLVVLDHGVLIAEGAPSDVIRNRQVIEAYLGKRWVDYATA